MELRLFSKMLFLRTAWPGRPRGLSAGRGGIYTEASRDTGGQAMLSGQPYIKFI